LTNGPTWDPDYRDAERIPYDSGDLGLPEWGITYSIQPELNNKYWGTAYRQVAGPANPSMVLAIHIMGIKDLWNNDALLDYTDRYMDVETGYLPVPFVRNMWNTYRENYGCVWRRDNPSDPYSNGRNDCEVPVARPESFLDKIIDWFREVF
jgi:hypothetical protein